MNSDQNIEIEIRGPLSAEKNVELKEFFTKNGNHKSTKERVLIDYSSALPGTMSERKKDIRLRITNGTPEIIVKLGVWGGSDHRKELSVTTGEHTFDTLVEIFSAMGYEKGVLCIRSSNVYEYKGIEFALVEVPGHSFHFEAEKMATETQDPEQITKKIRETCTELGLSIYSSEDFFAYVELLNKEANEVFDFTKVGPGYFKERFGF